MRPRWGEGGSPQRNEMDVPMLPVREGAHGERVHQIRRRLADDAYRSSDVAEEIARRILLSREL